MEINNTIAAIATALSPSGIGIVRVSGEDAIPVVDRIFHIGKKKDILKNAPSHTIHYGYIFDGEQKIDEVLVMLMRGPKSYTAEDTVEIDCHGGVLVVKKVLRAVLGAGARLAEPGEFTRRAFLNGRMDLSRAEAVIDVIDSRNDYALKSSVQQMTGVISEKIRKIREEILYESAFLESALDDPEHISLDGFRERLLLKNGQWMSRCRELLKNSASRRFVTEGIRTVILGRPNVGKSSLLNLLLGEERAIVTDVAGTTRDTLEEQVCLQDVCLNMIDTAGIRETQDEVEKIGVDRAMQQAEKADLLLFVADASEELTREDKDLLQFMEDRKGIVILNKTDLSLAVNEEEIKKFTSKKVIAFSAKTGTGLSQLEEEIRNMFYAGMLDMDDQFYMAGERHRVCLEKTLNSLQLLQESIDSKVPEDMYSVDLMDAYTFLGNIIGEAVDEDLVNEIFSRFCMGK